MENIQRLEHLNTNFYLISLILNNDDTVLYERSQKLSAIIGERVSVLPPDTRHVDYEIIPVIIADGCLYQCKFCCVKSAQQFKARSKSDILEQIRQLKAYYGRNMENYNALYLGNHDALEAGHELICLAASEAYKTFGILDKRKVKPLLFLFGSVNSLLKAENRLFELLNRLPFYTYINIGFESIDKPTLKFIGKPVGESKILEAFQKMLDVNAAFANIEITCNFFMGEELPPEHYRSLAKLLQDTPVLSHGKGAVYLSPLKDSPKKRELLPQFCEIKNQSQIPVYIYLIQRL